MKPVTIAGGGLAGLGLGVALRKHGVPVTLHEAASYPRHRVCGEFLNGVTPKTLDRLGVAEAFATARSLRSTRWHVHDKPVYEVDLPKAALGISRFELDQRMAAIFEENGGSLCLRSRVERKAREGLVWAAGRPLEPASRWIGLKVHALGLGAGADLEMHVGTVGYAGVSAVGEGRFNLCGLFRRQPGVKGRGVDLLRAYLEMNGMHRLSERLGMAEPDERSLTGVHGFLLGRQRARDKLCVLGDAESIIPPFTGNGMSMALQAAESAVIPLVQFASGQTTWDSAAETIVDRLRTRFRRRLFAAGRLHPLLFSKIGCSLMSVSARTGVLPFNVLFRALR